MRLVLNKRNNFLCKFTVRHSSRQYLGAAMFKTCVGTKFGITDNLNWTLRNSARNSGMRQPIQCFCECLVLISRGKPGRHVEACKASNG